MPQSHFRRTYVSDIEDESSNMVASTVPPFESVEAFSCILLRPFIHVNVRIEGERLGDALHHEEGREEPLLLG